MGRAWGLMFASALTLIAGQVDAAVVWARAGIRQGIEDLVYSPNADRYAYSFEKFVNVVNRVTGNLEMVLTAPAGVNALSWQNDGVYLGARVSPGWTYVWHMPDGGLYNAKPPTFPNEGATDALLIHNNWMYTQGGAWTIDGTQLVRQFYNTPGYTGSNVTFAPNGTRLSSTNSTSTIIKQVDEMGGSGAVWGAPLPVSFFDDGLWEGAACKWGSYTMGDIPNIQPLFSGGPHAQLACTKLNTLEYFILYNIPGETVTRVARYDGDLNSELGAIGVPRRTYRKAIARGDIITMVPAEWFYETLTYNHITGQVVQSDPEGLRGQPQTLVVNRLGTQIGVTTSSDWGYSGSSMNFFNATTGYVHKRTVTPYTLIAISPDGTLGVHIGSPFAVVFNIATGDTVASLPLFATATFSANGERLITNKGIYDTSNWQLIQGWDWAAFNAVSDGGLATSMVRHALPIPVYSASTGTVAKYLNPKRDGFIFGATVSRKGDKYAVAVENDRIAILSGKYLKEVRTVPLGIDSSFSFQPLSFSSDGRYLHVIYNKPIPGFPNRCSVRTYELDRMRIVHEMPDQLLGGGVAQVEPLPNPREFVVSMIQGSVMRISF